MRRLLIWHLALWTLVVAGLVIPRALTGGPRRGRRHDDPAARVKSERPGGGGGAFATPQNAAVAAGRARADLREGDEGPRIERPDAEGVSRIADFAAARMRDAAPRPPTAPARVPLRC